MVTNVELWACSFLGVYIGYGKEKNWDFPMPIIGDNNFNLGFINIIALSIGVFLLANPETYSNAILAGLGFESLLSISNKQLMKRIGKTDGSMELTNGEFSADYEGSLNYMGEGVDRDE
jgi:hypothetical protein